jgi:hypothetical protein
MSNEVSATIALAYLDTRLKAEREALYDRLVAANRFHQHLLTVQLRGGIESLDLARQQIARLLEWCEAANNGVVKANER